MPKKLLFPALIIIFLVGLFFLLPKIFQSHYVSSASLFFSQATTTEKTVSSTHIKTPDPVKGVYMTSWIASAAYLRNPLVNLIQKTELNSVVIDIKDYSGRIVFPVTDPQLKAYGSEQVRVPDMQSFIQSLHQKGIYVIGRVAVFQDAYFVKYRPDLAVKNKAGTQVWKDRKGISWIDAGSKEYWDYIVLLAKQAHDIGFDEINFDYIRFPSDGNMEDISYPFSSTTPKSEVLKSFFAYLHDHLKDTGLVTSADLFGQTTIATNDMGIGQVFVNALPYFDYVDPMVYPSHFGPGVFGYQNPEAHPYDMVYRSMKSGVAREKDLASTTGETLAVLRPWLQDFGLHQDYGPTEIKDQIQATYDDGLSSWLLWSASNKYTEGALESK